MKPGLLPEQFDISRVLAVPARRAPALSTHGRKTMEHKGASAGGRHGSNAKRAGTQSGDNTAGTDKNGSGFNGLNESTGEFRVGENIIFGSRNGNILLRRSPQGDEVEVGEATLAGLMIDAFFTDKFGSGKDAEYPSVQSAR
jgi:hypothetical protein